MTSLKYSLLVITGAIILASCDNSRQTPASETKTGQAPAAAATTIKSFSWLIGKWQMATKDGITYENWTMVNDSLLEGVSGMIKGKDTSVYEHITLKLDRNDIYYTPTVKDQNNGQPVPFKMTQAIGDSFVFENPQHDFPSKITYTRQSATAMLARISGKINGQEHAEDFPMTRHN